MHRRAAHGLDAAVRGERDLPNATDLEDLTLQELHTVLLGRRQPGVAPNQDRAHRDRRIKVDRELVATLIAVYGIKLDHLHGLRAQVNDAIQPAESDKLAWIRSHALRKTTATALDEQGHTRQIADQPGQAKVSITQDIYMGRQAAAQYLADPELF